MDSQNDMPLVGYVTLAAAIIGALIIGRWNPDLSYDLLIELGAATLVIFLLGVVLTRTNRNRWKAVKQQTEYLLSRTVHRIRQGVAVRAFAFDPSIDANKSFEENEEGIRKERRVLLDWLVEQEDITNEIDKRLWSEEKYFQDRANDVWELINMKNGEYIEPVIISELQDLYVYLEDLQSHIRTYNTVVSKQKKAYYTKKAFLGAEFCLRGLLQATKNLREMGYSEPPRYE